MLKVVIFNNKIQLRYDQINKSKIGICLIWHYAYVPEKVHKGIQILSARGRLLVKGLLL